MFEWLYQKIFIAVVAEENGYKVAASAYKKKKSLYKKNHSFEGDNAFDTMAALIRSYTEESPLHYIAVLNPDPNQGAIEGCSLHEISEEGDISGAKTLCRNQKWMLYASLRELEHLKKQYARVGLDFVFSPFSVLEHFFADKIGGPLAMYALAQKDSFSIAFFEEGKLQFAHHYPLHQDGAVLAASEDSVVGFSVGTEDEEFDRGINLDDIESLDELDIIDDLDDLDDLGDIEDLDAIEEISDFSEDQLTVEEKRSGHVKSEEIKENMDRFNDDYNHFDLIQKTLARFYAGEHCHNRFVETVYIADSYGGSGSELKHYLEEELFLSVMIRKIDLCDEIIALSMLEEEGL